MIRKFSCWVVCGCGMLAGCLRDVPIIVHRPVDFENGVDANHISVDYLNANGATIGGVTISGGNITAPGMITGENVVANNDVTAGGTVTGQAVVDLPDTPPPVPSCGNGVMEDGEECDGIKFGDQTCLFYHFTGGILTCDANCRINFSRCTVAPPPPPTPPLPAEPAPLMATLQSHNGANHFRVRDDVKLDFTVSGGVPDYDFLCQFVDGTFATDNNSMATIFSFKELEEALKIINSPGAGVVTCQVTDARGKKTSASFTIYVVP